MPVFQRVKTTVAILCLAGLAISATAEPMPVQLTGSWRIARVLPTGNVGCWTPDQARELVGSTLTYSTASMRWRGGDVSLAGIVTRKLSPAQFRRENSGRGQGVDFSQLGIHAARVLEIDLQHEDMDITGASTEVPGDSVLMAGTNRIVVSACGVFLEATRIAGADNLQRTSTRR